MLQASALDHIGAIPSGTCAARCQICGKAAPANARRGGALASYDEGVHITNPA